MLNHFGGRSRQWRPKKPLEAKRDQGHPAHQPRDWYDKATLLVAIAGLTIVAIYTGVTTYQAFLARETLRYAVGQQRAWIRISATPKKGLAIWRNSVSTQVNLKITNVGSVPATFVKTDIKLLPMTHGDATGIHVSNAYFDICKRNYPGKWGFTVFPGETLDDPFNLAEASDADIERVVGKSRMVNILLVTCIMYESGSDRTVHRTISAYAVFDKAHRVAPFSVNGVSALQAGRVGFEPFPAMDRAD